MSTLSLAALFLGAAVIAVPISKYLGLGSVLGYLAAGIVLGPWGLNLFHQVDDLLHIAEFGVVLLLFIIGLELQPRRLWALRKSVFGLGGAQLLITAAILTPLAYWFGGLSLAPALIVALALALSSTAFALQTLAEKHQLSSKHGRAAFSILLFQDLAVIPLLALVPLLGVSAAGPDDSTVLGLIKVVVVLAAVILGGHYLLRHVLKIVARTGVHEIFTAMALLTVVGTALLMEAVGLSMALGAFLAGVLLADSDYRHELEADIEPFKSLFLGLFFMAVGMSVELGQIAEQPARVLALVFGLVLVKFVVLYGLGRYNGLNAASARNLAISISQGGEFAFVILNVAVLYQIVPNADADLLILVVTLSMAVTPLLFAVNDWWTSRNPPETSTAAFDTPPEEVRHVIIAGFGRFGQIVGRVLRAKKIPFTALESDQEQVAYVRRFGNQAYYGDAARLDLLRAAGAAEAAALVLAIDDMDATLRAVKTASKHFPNLKLYARARNRQHAYQLMDLGVRVVWRETYLSSLDMTRAVLRGLGYSDAESTRAVARFQEHDEALLYAHRALHTDEEKMAQAAIQGARELADLFEQDAVDDAKT